MLDLTCLLDFVRFCLAIVLCQLLVMVICVCCWLSVDRLDGLCDNSVVIFVVLCVIWVYLRCFKFVLFWLTVVLILICWIGLLVLIMIWLLYCLVWLLLWYLFVIRLLVLLFVLGVSCFVLVVDWLEWMLLWWWRYLLWSLIVLLELRLFSLGFLVGGGYCIPVFDLFVDLFLLFGCLIWLCGLVLFVC